MPVPPLRIADHAERLSAHMTVTLPEGDGPHPVVIQLHGCGGRQPLHDAYAEAARAADIASVVIDSFAPRGIPRRLAQMTVCTGMRLRGAERSADLFAALHWLETQPWADTTRMAAAGWSHGGWTVMDAFAGAYPACGLIDGGAEALQELRAVFLVYPYAGVPSLTAARGWGANRPKVSAILCTGDAVVGHRAPRRALDRLARDGLEVEVMTLEGATHGFDDIAADDPRTRYDPDRAVEAHTFFADSLSRAFKS